MEALLCAPLTLRAQPQAARNIHGGGKAVKSSRRGVKQVRGVALAVGPAAAALHGEPSSSFGSRQLLAGGKFVGLRKSEVREFAKKRVWGAQSLKQQRNPLQTIQLTVRAGLSSAPETNLGLYEPTFDKDGCGVGFVAKLSQEPSRDIVSSPPRPRVSTFFSQSMAMTLHHRVRANQQCVTVSSLLLEEGGDHLLPDSITEH